MTSLLLCGNSTEQIPGKLGRLAVLWMYHQASDASSRSGEEFR